MHVEKIVQAFCYLPKNLLAVYVVGAATLFFASETRAVVVTYAYTGTIDSSYGAPFGISTAPSDPVSGTFSYDTDAVPSVDDTYFSVFPQLIPEDFTMEIKGKLHLCGSATIESSCRMILILHMVWMTSSRWPSTKPWMV